MKNPYPTVRRVSMWRGAVLIAAELAPEPDPLDVAAEVASMGASKAVESAFFAYEIFAATVSDDADGHRQALACATDAADRWLLMIDQLLDAGEITERVRDIHHDAWRRVARAR